jgi:hypothetical protein
LAWMSTRTEGRHESAGFSLRKIGANFTAPQF